MGEETIRLISNHKAIAFGYAITYRGDGDTVKVECCERAAHAIIKDAAREWLRGNDPKSQWSIVPCGPMHFELCRFDEWEPLFQGPHQTEAEAMLAAVDAVLKEKA